MEKFDRIIDFMEENYQVKLSQHELDLFNELKAHNREVLHLNGDLSRFAQRFASAIAHRQVTFPREGVELRAKQFAVLQNYLEIVFVCEKSDDIPVAELAFENLKTREDFSKLNGLNSIGLALALLKSGRIVVVVFAGLINKKEITSRVMNFVAELSADDFSVDALFDKMNNLRDKMRLPKLHKDIDMFKALNKICRKTNNKEQIEAECQKLTSDCGLYIVTQVQKTKHSDYFRCCFGNGDFVSIVLSPAVSAAMQFYWAHGFKLNVVVVTNEIRTVENSIEMETRYAETPQPKRSKGTVGVPARESVTPKNRRRGMIDATPKKLEFVEEKKRLCVSEMVTHADVGMPEEKEETPEESSDEDAVVEPEEFVYVCASPLVEDLDIGGCDIEAPSALLIESDSFSDVRFRLLDVSRRFFNHYSVIGSISQKIIRKINKFRRDNDLRMLRYDASASKKLSDLLSDFRRQHITYMEMKDNIWRMNERRSTFCCRTFSSRNQRTAKDEFFSHFISVDTMKCFLMSNVNRIAFAEFAHLNEVQLVCLIYVN